MTTRPAEAAFDLDNCAAAKGVTRQNDQIFENSQLCYQARAERLNDWASCLELGADPYFSPAACLTGVSLRSSVYVCDKHSDPVVVQQCNELLMVTAGADPAINRMQGLDAHRIEKTVQLGLGDSFNMEGVAITVDDEGRVVLPDYYPATAHVCRAQEEPPLAIGAGIQGAYLYVTGCTVQDAEVTIHYFRYNLPGLVFPENR